MNEDNLPSLLQMSAAQVAISVLNNPEIRDLINSYVLPAPSSKKVHFRSTVETKAEEKISKLSLPPVLKNAVKCSMRPMISQMSDWKQSYGSVLKDCTGFFTDADVYFKFFWKLNGQIDHQKIAKALVENQNVDIRERFMLACSLCLIDDGEHIWNSMTPGQKGFILLERGRFPTLCSAAVNIFIKALEIHREWAGKTTYRRISDLILLSSIMLHNVFILRHVLDIEPRKTHRRYFLDAARFGDSLTLTMDVSFVPSLEHLSCEKIVMSLLDDSDLLWRDADEYYEIKSKVTGKISKLIPCDLLQRKLDDFIAPLLIEVKNWIAFCEKNWTGLEIGLSRVRNTIPQCRLYDGTVDREKFLNILVKNRDINPLNRFILACIFCMFEDVLDLWNSLLKIEKGYLRHRCSTNPDISYFIIRHWIEWLESSTDKDWESFVAWALETTVWKSNIYMLKRVLQTLSPTEKSQYLVKALTGGQVSSDMMRFGLSIMSGDEREVIFRESPLQVFKCILSWPLRSVFVDFADKLWPYLTEDTFCSILEMILSMIQKEKIDYVELIVILKTFWTQSPDRYKKFAEKDSYMYGSLNFVLKYDFAQQFQRDLFLRTF